MGEEIKFTIPTNEDLDKLTIPELTKLKSLLERLTDIITCKIRGKLQK